MIMSLCYFLAARLGAYAPRLGAYTIWLVVYATFSIPRGSFDPKNVFKKILLKENFWSET